MSLRVSSGASPQAVPLALSGASATPPSSISTAAKGAIEEANKPAATGFKSLCQRIKHGFEAFGKKLLAIFKDIFCCCIDDAFTEGFEDGIQTPHRRTLKEILKSYNPFKVEASKKTPLEIDEADTTLRSSAFDELSKLSQALALHVPLSEKEKPLLPQKEKPSGIPNVGNSCYMNASLQNLDNLYGVGDPACVALLDQDLRLKPQEKLFALEERLLKSWAPIKEWDNRGDLEKKKLELEKQLSGSIDEESLKSRLKVEGPLATAYRALRLTEDRILFKWSFLLLLQAKKFNPTHLGKAAELHRKISFLIGKYRGFERSEGSQQDAPIYFELFHGMLDLSSPVHEYHTTFNGGDLLKSEGRVLPQDMIRLHLPTGTIAQLSEQREEIKPKHLKDLEGEIEQLKKKRRVLNQKIKKNPSKEGEAASEKVESMKKEISGLEEKIEKLKNQVNEATPQVLKALESEIDELEKSTFLDLMRRYFSSPAAEGDARVTFALDDGTELLKPPRRYVRKFVKQAPDFLVIQYLRYLGLEKDDRAVSLGFDPSKPFKLNKKSRDKYRVSGVVIHKGETPSSGHYIAYTERNGKWFLCDDSQVREVAIEEVEFKKAYLLSFKKVPSNLGQAALPTAPQEG